MIHLRITLLFLCLGLGISLYAPSQQDLNKTASLLEGIDNIVPVAVIGGGPAGLAASIPPKRAGYATVIFQGYKPGGDLMDSMIVENLPCVEKASGPDCMQKFEKQVLKFGVSLTPYSVSQVNLTSWPFQLTLNNGTKIHALTVIIATGATQKWLGIQGEETYRGRGVFTCGICDGSFTRNKDTIVIGGGNIAIQRALQLAQTARSITLIVPDDHLTAEDSMQRKLIGIHSIKEPLYNKRITKIVGDGRTISHVELTDTKTGAHSELKTSSIFLSTGLTPNTELFKGQLPLDSFGCIKLKNRSQETSIAGVQAAGNVADPRYRQVGAIIGDGTKAGMDAVKALSDWGFDGELKNTLLTKNLYKPAPITHPDILELKRAYELKKTIKDSSLPVLVEFYSPSCSSCRKMDIPVSACAEQFKKALRILKVNKDKFLALVSQQKISMVPAFILFMNGKEINRMEGEMSQKDLSLFIESSCQLKPKTRYSLIDRKLCKEE